MHIHLIAIGTKMPAWVEAGFAEYAKRFPSECRLQLIEIEAGKRGKNADIKRVLENEGQRMLAALPKNSHAIALDSRGKQWDTPQLAQQLKFWQHDGRNISLLIGGPEGFSPECLAHVEQKWSLSLLTLPHPLVRIVVAEQLYRAFTLLQGHPYHRN